MKHCVYPAVSPSALPSLTAEREFLSNVPAIDPDEPVPYALTAAGWAEPCPEGKEP